MSNIQRTRNNVDTSEITSLEPIGVTSPAKQIASRIEKEDAYENANIIKVTLLAGETKQVKDINYRRTHLSVFNTSGAAAILYGTSLGNCLLPIPANAERDIFTKPLYLGTVCLSNPNAFSIDAIVYEGTF